MSRNWQYTTLSAAKCTTSIQKSNVTDLKIRIGNFSLWIDKTTSNKVWHIWHSKDAIIITTDQDWTKRTLGINQG